MTKSIKLTIWRKDKPDPVIEYRRIEGGTVKTLRGGTSAFLDLDVPLGENNAVTATLTLDDPKPETPHVKARVMVHGRNLLFAVDEQVGIKRNRNKNLTPGAPLRCMSDVLPEVYSDAIFIRGKKQADDDRIGRFHYPTPAEAKDYARKIIATLRILNAGSVRPEDVPCKRCGRPGVLRCEANHTPWYVTCQMDDCKYTTLQTFIAAAWAAWADINRSPQDWKDIEIPEDEWIIVG